MKRITQPRKQRRSGSQIRKLLAFSANLVLKPRLKDPPENLSDRAIYYKMTSPGSLKMEIRYSDAQASTLVQAKHLSVCHLMDHLIRMLLITSAMPFFAHVTSN